MLAVPKWLRGLIVNQLFGSSILLGQPTSSTNQALRVSIWKSLLNGFILETVGSFELFITLPVDGLATLFYLGV